MHGSFWTDAIVSVRTIVSKIRSARSASIPGRARDAPLRVPVVGPPRAGQR
jgi:hypothetical protein